jgi:hypothetical protein
LIFCSSSAEKEEMRIRIQFGNKRSSKIRMTIIKEEKEKELNSLFKEV